MQEQASKPSKTKTQDPSDEKSKPVHVIVQGPLIASIHRRQSPSGFLYFAYSIKRSYRSLTSGKEAYSSDFFAENRADLLAVTSEATLWIAGQSEGQAEPVKHAA